MAKTFVIVPIRCSTSCSSFLLWYIPVASKISSKFCCIIWVKISLLIKLETVSLSMLKIACTPAETPRYRFRKPITPNALLPILGKAKIFPYISFSIESRRLRSHDGNVIRGETFRAKRKLQTSRISRIISLALYTGNNIANSRL